MRKLGIDEAGRGCVLGPLVIAGFVSEVDDDALTTAGATDSKRLSAAKRVLAREALSPLGNADVREVSPAQIDAGNLNTLEEEVIADLIRTHAPDVVVVDALGHPKTLPKVLERLRQAVGPECPPITMEPKADLNHPVVGAASIFAKVHRDARLDDYRQAWGTLGSGYPSDPATRAWLTAHARSGDAWPEFVRTRWGTVRDIAQQVLFDR